MAYLGQSPFGQTVRTTTSVVATAGQTTVYPTGGYTIGYIDVWVNGAKLTENADFTANDSLSVVFDPALDLNDQVETIAYGSFSFVDAVRRSGDTMAGTLNVQSLLPTSNNTYNLGSNTARFNDIYLSNSSIYLGDLILSSNATNVLLSNSSGLIGTMATGGGVNTFQYTAANATIDVTTTNGASYSVTLNVGNNSVAGILQIVDSTSNTSATIAASANAAKVAYDTAVTAQNMAANAYSNAASYADTRAATAYSNATSYADTAAGTAYSNAISYSGNAALAYANAISYAASNTYVNTTFAPKASPTITGTLSAADVSISGDLTVSGNLTTSGTTTYVNTTNLNIGDNIIALNADLGASAPTENAGLEINRGTSANVSLLWDETNDYWTFGNTYLSGSIQTTGAGTIGTTLAAGNTTVTGFINVSTSIAAANLNITGTVSADIITVSNVAQTQTNLEVDPAGTAFLNALIYG